MAAHVADEKFLVKLKRCNLNTLEFHLSSVLINLLRKYGFTKDEISVENFSLGKSFLSQAQVSFLFPL